MVCFCLFSRRKGLETCKIWEIIMKGTAPLFSSTRFTSAAPAFREEAGNKENRPACRENSLMTSRRRNGCERSEFPGIETSSTRKCKPRQPASFPFSLPHLPFSFFSFRYSRVSQEIPCDSLYSNHLIER